MYAAKLNSLAVVKTIVEYKPDVTLTDAVSEPQYIIIVAILLN